MDGYDTDILTWSQRQASLLRRLAAGERVNDAVDWLNVIEEIESVGRSEVDAVESLLFQAVLHMLKTQAWPTSLAVPHWRAEARGARARAGRKFRESMRGKIDVPAIYADALKAVPETLDGEAPLPVPTTCPVTLDDLLAQE